MKHKESSRKRRGPKDLLWRTNETTSRSQAGRLHCAACFSQAFSSPRGRNRQSLPAALFMLGGNPVVKQMIGGGEEGGENVRVQAGCQLMHS